MDKVRKVRLSPAEAAETLKEYKLEWGPDDEQRNRGAFTSLHYDRVKRLYKTEGHDIKQMKPK